MKKIRKTIWAHAISVRRNDNFRKFMNDINRDA